MTTTVGDFLLKRLGEWNIKRIYGYPGDGINGIMAAFGRQDNIAFIQAAHEELAAFKALPWPAMSRRRALFHEQIASGSPRTVRLKAL